MPGRTRRPDEVPMTRPAPALEPVEYRSLSVVIPVFNERATIARIVERVRSADVPLALEVICVDDGSTDGTAEALAALEPPVITVTHETNRGKGAAIRTGLAVATGDVVVVQDADLEYDPADWSALLRPILDHEAVVVYGSRFMVRPESIPLVRWLGNRALTLCTNLLYGSALSDMETCYKLFDRRVLEGIELEADRFDFEPEVTAKVLRSGHRIVELPISYVGRGAEEGKKITWFDGVAAVYALARFRFVRMRRPAETKEPLVGETER
jgi:glycosyltransferase involved in cell wall biosynthesis